MLVTAVDVVDVAHDHARLIPMLQQAEDTTGIRKRRRRWPTPVITPAAI